jgi:DNA-binding HxlR family transcriptional regulator
MCDVHRSLADLMNQLGMTHRTFFKRTHIEPLLKGGVLKMRYPEQPNHPHQAYVLTEVGIALAERVVKNLDDRSVEE